jgi:hypothetical protein
VLVYDSVDVEAHAMPDRVTVNLKEMGIAGHISRQIAGGTSKLAARLEDLRPGPASAAGGAVP